MHLDNMSEQVKHMDILEMGSKEYIMGVKDHEYCYVSFSSDW